jgi:hypothetical protein
VALYWHTDRDPDLNGEQDLIVGAGASYEVRRCVTCSVAYSSRGSLPYLLAIALYISSRPAHGMALVSVVVLLATVALRASAPPEFSENSLRILSGLATMWLDSHKAAQGDRGRRTVHRRSVSTPLLGCLALEQRRYDRKVMPSSVGLVQTQIGRICTRLHRVPLVVGHHHIVVGGRSLTNQTMVNLGYVF